MLLKLKLILLFTLASCISEKKEFSASVSSKSCDVAFQAGTNVTDATTSQVLSGYEFWTGDGVRRDGTMSNRGSFDVSSSFPGQGYYSGVSNLPSAEAICSGTTILGVNGTATCSVPLEVPLTVSGLSLWLRGDSITLSDGSTVSTWNESAQRSMSLSQTSDSARATYIESDASFNNQSVLSFDGNDYYDFSSNLFSSTLMGAGNSIFIVLSTPSISAHILGTGSSDSGYLETWGNGLYLNSSGQISLKTLNGSSSHLKVPSVTSNLSSPIIASTVTDCSSSSIYIDGSLENTSNTACSPETAYLNSTLGASDGYNYNTPQSFFSGKIAEIIIYNTQLSSNDREKIECYLSQRYSISVPHSCN